MSNADKFRANVRAFMLKWNYTPSEFGRKAIGDPSFVQRVLGTDRSCSLATVDRVEAWMEQQAILHKQGLDLRWTAEKPNNVRGRPAFPPIRWTRKKDATILRLHKLGKQWTEIGAAAGVSATAAKRRFGQLEKLRREIAKPTTPAGIAPQEPPETGSNA